MVENRTTVLEWMKGFRRNPMIHLRMITPRIGHSVRPQKFWGYWSLFTLSGDSTTSLGEICLFLDASPSLGVDILNRCPLVIK